MILFLETGDLPHHFVSTLSELFLKGLSSHALSLQLCLKRHVSLIEVVSGLHFLQERAHLTGQNFERLALVDVVFLDDRQITLHMGKFLQNILCDLFLDLIFTLKLIFLIFQLLQLGFVNDSLLLRLGKARLLHIHWFGLRWIRMCLLKLSDSILSGLLLKIL